MIRAFNFKKLLGFTSFFEGAGSVRKPNLPDLGLRWDSRGFEVVKIFS